MRAGTTSPLPLGERSARERRVRGPLALSASFEGPLTRPKRVDLSPQGEVGDGAATIVFLEQSDV